MACSWCPSAAQGRALLLGQIISLLVAGTGVCSEELANRRVNMPTSQSALNYLLLASLAPVRWLARRHCQPLRRGMRSTVASSDGSHEPYHDAEEPVCAFSVIPWYWLLLLAVVDVEANYLVVSAYQFTTITSVMLLDCVSIPASMLLLSVFVGTRFSWRHLVAACICIAGISVLVASDAMSASTTGQQPPQQGRWIGDLLCVAGACLYAVSNVAQELVVRSASRFTFLEGVGLAGSLVSVVQVAALSREEFKGISSWDWQVWILIIGFASCLFAMYVLTSKFLQYADAAVFNLALLTSDFWAVIVSVVLFQVKLDALYFVALALVVCGLVLYHSSDPPREPSVPTERLRSWLAQLRSRWVGTRRHATREPLLASDADAPAT